MKKTESKIVDILIEYYGITFQDIHRSGLILIPSKCCRDLALQFVEDLKNLKGRTAV